MKNLVKNIDKCICFLILFSILFIDKRIDLLECFFNLNFSFNFIAIILVLSLVILGIKKKTIKIDTISILLFIQLFYYIMQYIIIGGYTNNLFYFVDLFCCLCIYTYFRNTSQLYDKKTLFNIVFVFAMILSMQVIFTRVWLILKEIPSYQIKGYLQIPVGGSNYIASFLLVVFVLISFIQVEERKVLKYLTMGMAAGSVFITESEGAILSIFVFLAVYFFLKLSNYKKVKKFLSRYRTRIITIIIILSVLVSITILYIITNLSAEKLNSLSSGRIDIYIQYLDAIKCKILFGWGFYYEQVIGALAHNWFISNLLYGGIFGLIISCSPLLFLFYTLIKRKYDNCLILSIVLFLIVILHGLFEPNLGTIKFDILFWMTIGILLGNSNVLGKEIEINLEKITSYYKRKNRIRNTIIILVLFGVISWFQFYSLTVNYTAMRTLKLEPNDLSLTDTYAVNENKISVYSESVLKQLRKDNINRIVYNRFSNKLSYKDVLNSMVIGLDSNNGIFEIKVITSNENLSKLVCNYAIELVENKVKLLNDRDKISVGELKVDSSKSKSFPLIVGFEFIVIISINTMYIYYKEQKKRGNVNE